MLRKLLKTIVGVALIGAVAGLTWTGYGQIKTLNKTLADPDADITLIDAQAEELSLLISNANN